MSIPPLVIPIFTVLAIGGCAAPLAAQPLGYDFNNDASSDYPVSVISYDENNPDVGAARIRSGASKTIIHTIVGSDTNTLFGWSSNYYIESQPQLQADDSA